MSQTSRQPISLKPDGTIEVLNQCEEKNGEKNTARGVARFANPKKKDAHLKVSFAPAAVRTLPFVWADYCVIKIDDDYKYALVGEPRRRYLWILSREKKVSHTTFEELLKIAQEQGFDTTKLIRVKYE